MHIELLTKLNETKLNIWTVFVKKCGLQPDAEFDCIALIWEDDVLIASASRLGSLLKCIAVDNAHQGEGLTATLMTTLKNDALSKGIHHLFLCTKPQNKRIFSDLFFYPAAETEDILLMESKKDGLQQFINSLPQSPSSGKIGSCVMNCNPFTLGHRYLIETAAKECDILYVFVVSEDKSRFSATDRMEMVQKGTAHLPNVKVLPTGPYLISSATFPTYFLQDRENIPKIKCRLDVEIFAKHFAPHLNISTRYVGTEPISQATEQYNTELKNFLPAQGIEVKELPRLEKENAPISASRVRALLDAGNIREITSLVPKTTLDFLLNKGLI